jgi:hypothetical protein
MLTELLARADEAMRGCAGRIVLWRREHKRCKDVFDDHRVFLRSHNVLHPDRGKTVRDAGGMMRKEVVEGQSEAYKEWLKDRYDFDTQVREMVQACESFEKAWGDNFDKAEHIKKAATYTYTVVQKLESEWQNVLLGYPREQEITNTDAEVLEYVSLVLEKSWNELRDLEKAIKMPQNIEELDEKTKWEFSPISQYMRYNA